MTIEPRALIPVEDERDTLTRMEDDLQKAFEKESPSPLKPAVTNHYAELNRILGLAFNQAANGKGKDRHATSFVGMRNWEDQRSMQIAREAGPGGPSQQISKKAQEAVTLAGIKDFRGAKSEVLGVITYAATMYKLLEEMENASR